MDHNPTVSAAGHDGPPSLFSVVTVPAFCALLGLLILLVSLDLGATMLSSLRAQMRGDAIIGYQVETISRLARIEAGACAPPPR